MISDPFLNYFALGLLFFVVVVLFYGIIAIHDIPHLIAKSRDHPHQDAIHAAGWVSLFTLHALWPFLWIWAMSYRPDRGWGMSNTATPNEQAAGGRSELDFALVVELLPADRARLRKFGKYEVEKTGIEEIIENDMRKRPGVDVRGVSRRTQLLHARQRQERVERHILDRQHWIRRSRVALDVGDGTY